MYMSEYKICSHCVMDTNSDPSMIIEDNGKCERCNMYERTVAAHWNHGRGHEKELEALLVKIKKAGKGKKYDCLIGLSGGFDSTYVLHMAVKDYVLLFSMWIPVLTCRLVFKIFMRYAIN